MVVPDGPLPIAVACPVALIVAIPEADCWSAWARVEVMDRIEIASNRITKAFR